MRGGWLLLPCSKVALFDSKTDEVLLRKHYLPRYQLVLDDNNTLKINNILFFWEAMPPEVDEAYGIEKMEWGKPTE